MERGENQISGTRREGYSTLHTQNLIACSKFANKPSRSCVRTACPKLSTSMQQAINNLLQSC